jgi:tellurite resistance protein
MGLLNHMFASASAHAVVTDHVGVTEMPPAAAFAAVIVAAIAADGYLAPEEADALLSSLSRMHLFSEYSEEALHHLLESLCQQLQHDGVDALFAIAKHAIPTTLHATAFAVATDLVLADGLVSGEEQDFLKDLCQVLAIDQATATKIVDVMIIKNRG